MATSLLRLGRLGSVKGVLREGWGTPRTSLIAALCTKSNVPPKTTKKAKASTDERASLLAYKPAVAFPSKLSATGFLPKDVALGKADAIEAVSTAAASETAAGGPVADAEEAKISEVPPTKEVTTKSEGSKASVVESEVQKDQDDSSSSSSSSSDSDSDSDSDDEKPKTETAETLQTGANTAEEKKAPAPTPEQVEKKAKLESASYGETQESAKTVTKAKPGEVPALSAKLDETLIDPAPILSSSTNESTPEMSSQSIKAQTNEKTLDTATEVRTAPVEEIAVEKEPEIKAEDAVKVAPEVVAEASPEEVVERAVEASPGVGPETSGDVAAEDTSSRAEAGTPAAPSEELLDPASVSADAVEVRAETDLVETPEEQAPEKAPEPEPEPFENTSYKNLQHHDYNMYTFSDMDLEMSKYRLPQPSSGRH